MFRTDLLSVIRSLNTVFTTIGICHTSYIDCLLGRSGWNSRLTSLADSTPLCVLLGRDSTIGIATRYGVDGPGIESRLGGRDFPHRPDRPGGPLNLLHNGYRVFTGSKAARAWR